MIAINYEHISMRTFLNPQKILGPANRGGSRFSPVTTTLFSLLAQWINHDITAAVKAADNTDMAVAWIKDKVSRLGIAP